MISLNLQNLDYIYQNLLFIDIIRGEYKKKEHKEIFKKLASVVIFKDFIWIKEKWKKNISSQNVNIVKPLNFSFNNQYLEIFYDQKDDIYFESSKIFYYMIFFKGLDNDSLIIKKEIRVQCPLLERYRIIRPYFIKERKKLSKPRAIHYNFHDLYQDSPNYHYDIEKIKEVLKYFHLLHKRFIEKKLYDFIDKDSIFFPSRLSNYYLPVDIKVEDIIDFLSFTFYPISILSLDRMKDLYLKYLYNFSCIDPNYNLKCLNNFRYMELFDFCLFFNYFNLNFIRFLVYFLNSDIIEKLPISNFISNYYKMNHLLNGYDFIYDLDNSKLLLKSLSQYIEFRYYYLLFKYNFSLRK